ncbi:MAG: hypothetical protein ACERKD_13090 [Prolixibacteraceae bacterium]
MKSKLTLIFVLFFLVSCQEKFDAPTEFDSSKSQVIYDEILEAYDASCNECLETVFQEWGMGYDELITLTGDDAEAEAVYKTLFQPWKDKDAYSELAYPVSEYYVLQNNLRYNFDYAELPKDKYSTNTLSDSDLTIKDFHPRINDSEKPILFTNKIYSDAIEAFLTIGKKGTFELSKEEQEEIANREAFIEKHVLVNRSHWELGFSVESYPKVDKISFNTTKDSALVMFTRDLAGGNALLVKTDGEWVLKTAKISWIQ